MTLSIAQIASPRRDPAFDPKHDDFDKTLRRYASTRQPKDLAAIPLREGRRLRLFHLRQLTPEQVETVSTLTGVARTNAVVLAGCLSYAEPEGRTVQAPLRDTLGVKGEQPVAEREWLATLSKIGGQQLLPEIASVIVRWTEIGDLTDEALEDAARDPFALYGLPPGLTL